MLIARAIGADEWEAWRRLRLEALADAPEAFTSTLADWGGSGDTEARWRTRLEAVDQNLLAELDGRALGMVSVTAPIAEEVELISMWVAPEGRGRGIGDALVDAAMRRAREQGASRVALDVREQNRHAIALYERHGFADVGPASAPGDPFPERRMVADVARDAR